MTPECADSKCRRRIRVGQQVYEVKDGQLTGYIHAEHATSAEFKETHKVITFTEDMNWLKK
jgi:hypothetical protein